ncbi:MAG: DNA replication/repair protein RecF [Firmicutes bacterium]|nr:DNA replication/repair protein RecF [Bacillota bacterium]
MRIDRLRVENFRNYAACEIGWHEQVNIIVGMNGQGKSNLLEAISYLSLASSFRGADEAEMLRSGAEYFYLEGGITTADGAHTLSAAYGADHRRRVKLDGQARRERSALVGFFHTVIFSPEDLQLVKGAPQLRRRYINAQLSQLSPTYCADMLRYNRLVRQRNALLDAWLDQPQPEQLEVFDEQLIEVGAAIITARRRLIRELQPRAAALQQHLAPAEPLLLSYESTVREGGEDVEAVKAAYREELQRKRRAEIARAVTMVGPHRDDLHLSLNGAAAKAYASQGQQRTIALALKLAELQLAGTMRDDLPVLLLDDVMSELDEHRRSQLLSHLDGAAQTFITATDINFAVGSGKRFVIDKGNVVEESEF